MKIKLWASLTEAWSSRVILFFPFPSFSLSVLLSGWLLGTQELYWLSVLIKEDQASDLSASLSLSPKPSSWGYPWVLLGLDPGTATWVQVPIQGEWFLFCKGTEGISESKVTPVLSRWRRLWSTDPVDLILERQQWALAWSQIIIPCPGIEPGYPGWKPGNLATRSARATG